jgi:pilus assembly protein CpaB
MNRNRMLVLAIIALILSGGVTYLAYKVLQAKLQPAEATDKVVVAAKRIPLGYKITKGDVKLVDWPKSTPLEGSFSDPILVIDRGSMAPLQMNEPILESKLALKGAGAGLMTVIPEGMRALSIQVNSIIGVAGFISPGARVDLILTAVPPKDAHGAKDDEMGAKIVLENLEVLAAGQNLQRDVDGKPQTVQDVTLLVTPDQAQRVALAPRDGGIQLALRNPMDNAASEPNLVVRSPLYAGPTMDKPGGAKSPPSEVKAAPVARRPARTTVARSSAPRPVVAPPPPPARTVVVEVIQGTKRSEKSFEELNPEQH